MEVRKIFIVKGEPILMDAFENKLKASGYTIKKELSKQSYNHIIIFDNKKYDFYHGPDMSNANLIIGDILFTNHTIFDLETSWKSATDYLENFSDTNVILENLVTGDWLTNEKGEVFQFEYRPDNYAYKFKYFSVREQRLFLEKIPFYLHKNSHQLRKIKPASIEQIREALLIEAHELGFIPRKKVKSKDNEDSFVITYLAVMDGEYKDMHSNKVREFWEKTKKPFVFAVDGMYSVPLEELTLCKEPFFGGKPVFVGNEETRVEQYIIQNQFILSLYERYENPFSRFIGKHEIKISFQTEYNGQIIFVEEKSLVPKTINVGCTTGTWEELKDIVEEIKRLQKE